MFWEILWALVLGFALSGRFRRSTILSIILLALAALLVWRYFRGGGGLAMLRMMDKPMGHEHGQAH